MQNNYIHKIKKQGQMKVDAVVYASDKLFQNMQQDKTLQQLKNVATLPGIENAIAMPDAHQGYGFPIGGVAGFDLEDGVVCPGAVGYDISCGVEFIKTNISFDELKNNKKQLLDALAKNIPAGLGSSNVHIEKDALNEVLFGGAKYNVDNGFLKKQELKCFDDDGQLEVKRDCISDKAKKRGKNQLGSLGAGNHFAEVQYIDKIFDQSWAKKYNLIEGNLGIMLHCGSRGLGHQVADDYMKEISKKINIDNLTDRELIHYPINSKIADDYFCAMKQATNYAYANRSTIYFNIKQAFEKVFDNSADALGIELIRDISHNIARVEKHKINSEMKKLCIYRKGATALYDDKVAIVPGSMGTASYLVSKSDNAEELSFCSTAHGAGRIMSRHKAKKTLNENQIRKDLIKKNIMVHSASKSGFIEEAPEAYKDIEEVIKTTTQLKITNNVAKLKPILVVKG